MSKISHTVCVLLLVVLIFSGCGNSSEPADSDKTLITITSNGETILPYQRFSWGTSRTDNGWVSADALQLVCELPDIAAELPVVSYHDDFAVQYNKGISYSYMTVYNESFEYLDGNAPYDDIDYLTCLAQLPEGIYYVGIAVSKQGDYYLFENRYESSGYDCVFKLKVGQ